jgi:hypothetical protein
MAATAACAAGTVAVFAAGRLGNSWLEAKLFPTGAFNVDSRVLHRMTTPRGLARILCDGTGQIWHLATSTWGLAALGLVVAIKVLLRREWTRATRVMLVAALAMTVGIALATAAGIPDEGRVNNHVYGRYVALFAAFWPIVGIAGLARAGRRWAAIYVLGGALLAVSALGLVLAWAGRRMRAEGYVNFDAPELSFIGADFHHLHYLRVTAYAVGFMVLFALAYQGWRRAGGIRGAAATGALLILNLVAMVVITDRISLDWYSDQYGADGPPTLVRDVGVRPGDTVAEASTVTWSVNQRHQREIYWRPLTAFDQRKQPPPAGMRYVILSTSDPSVWQAAQHGYVQVLRHNEGLNTGWVVWRLR